MAERTGPAGRDKWIKFAGLTTDLPPRTGRLAPFSPPFVDFNPCHD